MILKFILAHKTELLGAAAWLVYEINALLPTKANGILDWIAKARKKQ